jgi:hypothetical protein
MHFLTSMRIDLEAADEQIGWSGVPLSKTCGYTGKPL